ncbi:MAG: ABC transporter ATP-binding protein [Mobilibacterium timonense]|uniref:ABC transporter ATP-binding protein n=1 Tax=Mobilibacterium timonense TaxID=1871012 RepID=UPI002354197D|nr:ABC transporter ATP-binding protein [Mobilibacterium timonense]MBM6991142.1 ABC transporter ATP-binding protein [Mobilibacterium timonense]
MELLQVKDITKVFPTPQGEDHVVLEDVNFSVNEGEFISLLGPSGCGKTTLLTMIGGFQEPTSGAIFLDGNEITGPSAEKGYVFQNYALFPWMTVEKNIAYGLQFKNMTQEEKNRRVDEMLQLANLKGHEEKLPIQLSGGMQQRVAVARALACKPRVLLLDEPLGAVDFQMRELMQNQLDMLVGKAGITVVMVTHDVAESVFLSDRVLVMGSSRGEILEDVTIRLPKPRDRDSEEYIGYVEHLTSLLRKAFGRTEA